MPGAASVAKSGSYSPVPARPSSMGARLVGTVAFPLPHMPVLTELIERLDGLLAIDGFRDYCPNGLQVPGRDDVQTVVTGVSAHGALLRRAVEEGADLVVV